MQVGMILPSKSCVLTTSRSYQVLNFAQTQRPTLEAMAECHIGT